MTAKPTPRAKKLTLGAAVVALVALLYKYVPTSKWDSLRHWLAYSVNPHQVGPIIAAVLIVVVLAVVILVLVRPSFRKVVTKFLHSHLGAFIASLVEQEVQKQLPTSSDVPPGGTMKAGATVYRAPPK